MDLSKIGLLKQRLESAEKSVASAKKLLEELSGGTSTEEAMSAEDKAADLIVDESARVVEGVFDGESMIGPDKRRYPVPANYASKSKLVEGDILKLTIGDDGKFMYKQIGPVERKRVSGVLEKEPGGTFFVKSKGGEYRILLASVTYFQAEEGDEVTLVVPKDSGAQWGAVENVIRSGGIPSPEETIRHEKEEAIKDLEEATSDIDGDNIDQMDEFDSIEDL